MEIVRNYSGVPNKRAGLFTIFKICYLVSAHEQGGFCYLVPARLLVLQSTLLSLISEHARQRKIWNFSCLLTFIKACSLINFQNYFLPARLLHPARKFNFFSSLLALRMK